MAGQSVKRPTRVFRQLALVVVPEREDSRGRKSPREEIPRPKDTGRPMCPRFDGASLCIDTVNKYEAGTRKRRVSGSIDSKLWRTACLRESRWDSLQIGHAIRPSRIIQDCELGHDFGGSRAGVFRKESKVELVSGLTLRYPPRGRVGASAILPRIGEQPILLLRSRPHVPQCACSKAPCQCGRCLLTHLRTEWARSHWSFLLPAPFQLLHTASMAAIPKKKFVDQSG